MRIVEMLIPSTNKKMRPGIALSPLYITVHETGNQEKGATALAHAELQQKGNSRQASWHFTVDDGGIIYQSIPTNEVAWHAGDGGRGPGNLTSIAMELCVNVDGNFEKTKTNGRWLIQYLMGKYHIKISHVVPHQHWSGKDCPTHILATGWDKFINQLKQ